MSLKDGVMASFVKDKWYVMIRAVLSKQGAALASKENAVVQIHEVCDPLEKDGTHFVYSGTPFHSYKSSSNATKEISIITTVSMLVVLAILLLIFKRPHPIVFSLLSILISMTGGRMSSRRQGITFMLLPRSSRKAEIPRCLPIWSDVSMK